jgi:hypothetical protein
MHNREKILLVVFALCLTLFLIQSKVLYRGSTSAGNTLNISLVKKSVDKINPENAISNKPKSKSASEKDYLGMSIEELMQIPVATVSMHKNTGLLDKSIEELMQIPVTGFASEQRRKT